MNVKVDAPDPDVPGDSTENNSPPSENNAEFKPPSDGSWVPRERLNKLSAKIDDLSKQLSKQVEEKNTPKPVSRKDLLEKVDAGEMSQVEADEISEKQLEYRVADQVETVIKNTAVATKLQEELSAYENSVPELSDESSELYANVKREYQYLVQTLGMPDTTNTTLAAVRSIVGPANALKKIGIRKQTGDGHQENSGNGTSGSSNSGGKTPQMTTRQKEYYSNGIRNGAYENWDAVYKELKAYNA